MKRYKLSQWNSWGLWERWVLATSVAEVIGLAIIAAVTFTTSKLGYVNGVFSLIGTLEGIVLGFSQWLVLRRYIRHSRRWILATTVGALLAWFIGLTVSTAMALAYANTPGSTTAVTLMKGVFLLGAGLGTVLGFFQWLVLKNQIRFSVWWISANALAWALGLLVAFIGAGLVEKDLGIQAVLFTVATGATIGAVVGGITGIALIWLLKPRRKSFH